MPLDTAFTVPSFLGRSQPGSEPAHASAQLNDLPDNVLRRVARHLCGEAALAFGSTSKRIERALHDRVLLPLRLVAQIPWMAAPPVYRQAVERLLLTRVRRWPVLIPMLDRQGAEIPQSRAQADASLAPLEARLTGPTRVEVDVECLLNLPLSQRFRASPAMGQPNVPPSLAEVLALPLPMRARVLPRWMKAMRDSLPRLPLKQWLDIVGTLPTGPRIGALRTLAIYGFAGLQEERQRAQQALLDSALADPTAPGAFDMLHELARHHWDRDPAPLVAISQAAAGMPAAQRLVLQSFLEIADAAPMHQALQRWDQLATAADDLDDAGKALLLQGLTWFALAMRPEEAAPRLARLCDGAMSLSPTARAGLLPELVQLCDAVLRGQRGAVPWHPPAWMTADELALTVAHLARHAPPSKAIWTQMIEAVFALPERSRFPAVLEMGKLMLGFQYRIELRMFDVPEGVEGAPWPVADAAPPAVGGHPAHARCREWPSESHAARDVLAGLLELVPMPARSRMLGALIDHELREDVYSNGEYLIAQCRKLPATDRRLPALVGKLIRLTDICHSLAAQRDAMLVGTFDIAIYASWTEHNAEQWRHLTESIHDRLSMHARERLSDMLRALWQQPDSGLAGAGV